MADSAALAIRDRLDGRAKKPRTPKQQKADDEAILREARERWARCDEAEDEQRKSILAAKKFRAGDQWPEAIKIQRQGSQGIAGVAAQPPRPCLTIDRVSAPVRQVSNSIKNANLGFDVLPNGFGADSQTAEIFKGYLRYVQVNAREESPIEWAADGAAEGGLGWLRLRADYVDQAPDQPDPSVFYQELKLERITNSLSVYCDPSSKKPTRSDAQFMFITEDLSKEEFKRQFHKTDADVQGIEDFCSTGDMKGWVDQDNVRIAEYWRITYRDEKWIRTAQGIAKVDDFPPDVPNTDRRLVRRPVVEGRKINAIDVLESWDWLGTRIPIFPVQGEELNVDGQTILRGMIQEAMDAQRMLNYTFSGAIEIFALGPKAPFIVEEEQLGDYQQIWQTANTFNYSYLPYKFRQGVEPPHRETAEAPIQAAVHLMGVSEEAIKATTNYYDSGLGANDGRVISGRAKQSEIQQSEQGSSNYLKSVEIAVIAIAQQVLLIAPQITQPGQLIHILGKDDEVEQVILGQAFTQDQKTKMAQPATGPNGQPITPEMAEFQKGVHKFYDWRKGRYAVTASMGKASATKREEGKAAIGELINNIAPAAPQMAMVLVPDYIETLNIDKAHKLAELARKTLPLGLQPDDGNGQDPQRQADQQKIQQLEQMLQSKVAEKQAEAQAKGQLDLQKTQFAEQAETQRTAAKLQVEERARALDNLVKLAIAEISAKSAQSQVDAEQARTELGFHQAHQDRAHEAVQGAHDRTHEAIQNELDRRHEQAVTTQEQAVQASENAQDREAAKQKPAGE